MSPTHATLKYKYNHAICSISCSQISSDILYDKRCMSFQLKSGALYFEFSAEFSLMFFPPRYSLVWFFEETFEFFKF